MRRVKERIQMQQKGEEKTEQEERRGLGEEQLVIRYQFEPGERLRRW